jgi:Mrp family chromosome partitioning ATPase
MQTAEGAIPRGAARLRRIDLRVAVGILLMLLAVVGAMAIVSTARDRVPVIVAARAVEQGDVIEPADLGIESISVSGGVAHLTEDRRDAVVGKVASERLWPGKLLSSASVADSADLPAGYVATSLALKTERAAGGALRSGDRVAVIASPSPDRPDSMTTILFTSVPVLAVREAETAEGGGLIVTLRLRPGASPSPRFAGPGPAVGSRRVSLVAVGAGKGAPGCSFVSINLATALAATGPRVLLLDLDPHGGDLTAYLNLDPRKGMNLLARTSLPFLEALNREAELRQNVLCVGGFPRAADSDHELIEATLAVARGAGQTVVADLGRVGSGTAPHFSSADLVLIVVRPGLVAVHGARRAIQDLQDAGIPSGRIHAVINGWERQRPADLAESDAALPVRTLGAIPLDRKVADRSGTRG